VRLDRQRLAGSVRRAALPYGYTVVTWTSGGVLIHEHGPPDLLSAYLVLFGSGLALGLIALAAGAHTQDADAPPRESVAASLLAGAAALGVAGLCAGAIHGRVAYFLVGLAGSLVYFVLRAVIV
jgi:hypothetical protein